MKTYCLIHTSPGRPNKAHLFRTAQPSQLTNDSLAEALNIDFAYNNGERFTVAEVENLVPKTVGDDITDLRNRINALAADTDGDVRAIGQTLKSYTDGADDAELKSTIKSTLDGLEIALEKASEYLGMTITFGTPHKRKSTSRPLY